MYLFADLFRSDILGQLGEWGVVYGLIIVRILGFVHTAPILSHKSLTSMTRIGFAIFLSLIAVDVLEATPVPEEGYFLPFAVLFNASLGLLMGWVANLMFHTVVAGGEMIDSSMGFSSGQMFDPSTGKQTTIIGRFMGMLSIVVFFYVRGPEILIKGLLSSYDSIGLYETTIAVDPARLISLAGDIIVMGFLIVSPVVLTILVVDLILGLVSRAAPQINAFQISFTIKPVVGNIVLLLILPLFFSALMNFFTSPSRFF